MTREDVLRILSDHRAILAERGVEHAALFGSLARGEQRPESDIDLFIEFSPDRNISLWAYAEVVDYLRSLLGADVDVAEREALHAHVRPSAERDAVYAF